MKMIKKSRKITAILLLLLLFVSCRKDDCYTPPEPVVFEFLDANNQNILANGTIDISKIVVKEHLGDGKYQGVQLTAHENHRVKLELVGRFNGSKNYVGVINLPVKTKTFEFGVKSSRIEGDCKDYRIDQIDFSSIAASKQPGFYRLVVD